MRYSALIIKAMLAAYGLLSAATVSATGYYGFAPNECPESEINAIGTGANAFMEAAIRLDPQADALVARLAGRSISGVRCYLRADYKQKSKGFSCVKIYRGSLDAEPVVKTVNFTAGWNEVLLDEPVVIGDEPVYVGYQVFETQGVPYPIATYRNASFPGACLINPKTSGWQEYTDRGALMVQAIVEGADEEFAHCVAVGAGNVPLIVAPGAEFDCTLFVHNQGAQPLTELEYSCLDSEGTVLHVGSVSFGEGLAAYGSAAVQATLVAPMEEGSSVPVLLRAKSIDSVPANESLTSALPLYVSADVFSRVPLVEEFTGLSCQNCPFMFYYLDKALEEANIPHVYVAHHAGFVNDELTMPCDEAMLYLFGGSTFNPAAMYDRRVFGSDATPIMGANEPSTQPYLDRISEAMRFPALAKVLVDETGGGGSIGCHIYGKISKAMLDRKDGLYISAYLVEDPVPADKYRQIGLDPLPDGAPDDLLDRFCHRGVIRHVYNSDPLGDMLSIDADGNFEVSFPETALASDWDASKCSVIAAVHKVDQENLKENYVLNAGAKRWNDYANGVGICPPSYDSPDRVRVYIDANGRAACDSESASLRVFTAGGAEISASSRLNTGLYIVEYRLADGSRGTSKLLVH